MFEFLIMVMINNGKKVGPDGSEEFTKTRQEFGLHIEMGTVNGLFAVGGRKVQ